MARLIQYAHYFTVDDVCDFAYDVQEGVVVGFTASYRAVIGGTWAVVARYDTCHGHLHVHKNWLVPDRRLQDLEDPARPRRDYAADLERARLDIFANWRTYRRRMERVLR